MIKVKVSKKVGEIYDSLTFYSIQSVATLSKAKKWFEANDL